MPTAELYRFDTCCCRFHNHLPGVVGPGPGPLPPWTWIHCVRFTTGRRVAYLGAHWRSESRSNRRTPRPTALGGPELFIQVITCICDSSGPVRAGHAGQ